MSVQLYRPKTVRSMLCSVRSTSNSETQIAMCRYEQDSQRHTALSEISGSHASPCECCLSFGAADSAPISFAATSASMLLAERTRSRRNARACDGVSTGRADCCCELLLRAWRADEERSRWTERVRFADLAFWRGVGLFAILLTWKDQAARNRARGEKFWSSRPVYIFVNAVRAPHPLGEESGFGGWGAKIL